MKTTMKSLLSRTVTAFGLTAAFISPAYAGDNVRKGADKARGAVHDKAVVVTSGTWNNYTNTKINSPLKPASTWVKPRPREIPLPTPPPVIVPAAKTPGYHSPE